MTHPIYAAAVHAFHAASIRHCHMCRRHTFIAGAGLLLQPEVLVAHDLASGALVPVLEAYLPEPHPIHIVYRQDRRPLPKLTRFVEYLIEQVGGRDGA